MSDARNRSNVIVGAPDTATSGGLLLGAVATETEKYPKDAKTKLDTALGLKPAGFIGEDGITKTVDRSTEKIKDWNKDTVIVVETDHNVVIKMTFLEAKILTSSAWSTAKTTSQQRRTPSKSPTQQASFHTSALSANSTAAKENQDESSSLTAKSHPSAT